MHKDQRIEIYNQGEINKHQTAIEKYRDLCWKTLNKDKSESLEIQWLKFKQRTNWTHCCGW